MQINEKNTNIDELLYPLKLSDIFTRIDDSDKVLKIPDKKVLLNANTNYPISIVSNEYEIVTNKEAFEYGSECLKTLFRLGVLDKVEVFNIIRPYTLSFCHIDLICSNKSFQFKNDKYIPFVRITNSYNKMFKLYFRVGVCRSICENGMIFGEDAIRFSYNHIRGFKEKIKFEIETDDFDKILNKFKSDVDILSSKVFNFEYSFPMVCKGIGLKVNSKIQNDEQQKRLYDIKYTLNNSLEKYQMELGNSFYAIYNVITDIGTRGFIDEKLFVTRVHNRQFRAGKWLREVSDILRKGEMNYDTYLKDFLEISKN